MASPNFSNWNPHDWIIFGPDSNCTLELCPVEWSVLEYRPSLAANISFIVLFGISLVIHLYQGVRWHKWAFMIAIFWGCVCEMIGYGGRIILYQNPFNFAGFISQIVCITIGPAFYSAAIYFTLSEIIVYLGTQYARLPPAAYYYIFITCDIISLTLQGTGGGMSSNSSGSSYQGVDIAIAGLSFQVFTLSVFICLAIDYAVRYWRGRKVMDERLTGQFKLFVVGLALAVLFIMVRCVYRIDELSRGYTASGSLIHNEGLFVALEGVMVLAAVYMLNVAHPGPAFASQPELETVDEGANATHTEVVAV